MTSKRRKVAAALDDFAAQSDARPETDQKFVTVPDNCHDITKMASFHRVFSYECFNECTYEGFVRNSIRLATVADDHNDGVPESRLCRFWSGALADLSILK